MHAAVLHEGADRHTVVEVRASALGPRDVLVRTVATGVCHSDRAMQLGARPLPRPLVLGHETAGVVEQVGVEVIGLSPGDPIVATAAPSCGSCWWCRSGHPQQCLSPIRSEARLVTERGEELFPFARVGGFATHLLLHERSAVPVPVEMPLEVAALLGCAVLTGVGAVRNCAGVEPGQRVAVLGCGGVGLSSVQAARMAGAGAIVAIDRRPEVLDLARRLGATLVVNAAEVDAVEVVRNELGGVDHVIECVGAAAALRQAWDMLDVRGTVTAVGFAPGQEIRLPLEDLLLEKRLQGSKLGSADPMVEIPAYCAEYLRGEMRLDEMVSNTISLDDLDDALALLDVGVHGRSVVRFSEARGEASR